ncbi:MAG: D-alanine--poly(phosphoribitol) ligase subunit 2 [Gemmatimonadetes bacterium SCN 70-22]|jgi:D-alanine--poly(phosphoribitol) ligase subunit 2|nr:MAG: D-alanine--poly(phosphoribitol) ligase subunit 2 [Gemmatimonadetes bacterium SCN 70-22]
MDLGERVAEIIARVADTDIVIGDREVRLYDRGILDSIATVELLLELSREFGVELSPAEVDREEWATPNRIAQYLEQRIAR